ncbi:hypothetical protein ACIP5Y_14480 [Nocardia sp. NPDC088792]|uniref:hypothetical protein n=1 Tax=Nocardia sp. NPDC088792 TaxID=3364332 RepID=UPI0038064E90
MRKITACAALVVGAVSIAAAPAYADPADAPAATPGIATVPTTAFSNVPAEQSVSINGVDYTVDKGTDSMTLNAPNGTFKTVGDTLVISNANGDAVDSIPLSYRKDNTQFPIAAQIADHSVTLTPNTDPTAGVPSAQPVSTSVLQGLVPVAQAQPKDITESFTPRDQQELSAFGSRATISSLTGAVVGALIGASVGCIGGGLVGAGLSAPLSLMLAALPGAVIGCVAGIALVGSVGSLLGTILVGGPMVLWSAYQYFSTISSPCYGPGAYCVDPAAPAAPK